MQRFERRTRTACRSTAAKSWDKTVVMERERERAQNYNVLLDSVWYSCISRGKAGNPPKSDQQGPESGSPDPGKLCLYLRRARRPIGLGTGSQGLDYFN